MNLLPSFLRRPTALLAFAALWLGAPLHLLAQPATGTIAGRVFHPASGQYVEGARITVPGTALETFTDNDGTFRLDGVPAGDARVRVFYTGTAPRLEPVRITAGQTAQLDVSLAPTAAPPPAAPGEVVQLDQFTVATSREMDGAAIAINEQRFAAQIKTDLPDDRGIP